MIDFHTHILPDIDDGSINVEMSCELISQGILHNVDKFIFTPHFYNKRTSIEQFLENRRLKAQELSTYLENNNIPIPDYHLGAEVYLSTSTNSVDDLEKLCIQGTELILVEMPYKECSNWVTNVIYNMTFERKLMPIIAHLDRYVGLGGYKTIIDAIIKMDIPVQINAEAFMQRDTRKLIKRLIKSNSTIILGSDVHNLSNRNYILNEAKKISDKKFGEDFWKKMNKNAEELLSIYKK